MPDDSAFAIHFILFLEVTMATLMSDYTIHGAPVQKLTAWAHICKFVLTLNERGLSRWGGDCNRGNLNSGLASPSDITLVV